ncbi:MAG: DNA mismatch endonuclease Vsr [Pseudomonadota bacterium]|nr:DNA mismatch endonuclease Vsr [Pseudomonadota bacterium]
MVDTLSEARRSANMSAIRSKGMKPEMIVRSLVHRMGYRFRLHVKDLPGKPDLVFRPRSKAIFVHGCFWHQHDDPKCLDGRLPKSRLEYWLPKLERNAVRDRSNQTALRAGGWKVLTIWECETKNLEKLEAKLRGFLG